MQPQNWRECRCTHCNFRALKHIRDKGFYKIDLMLNRWVQSRLESQIGLKKQQQADQSGGGAFTFAGFAVWLQSEANRTAAAHSCDRVVTRAVTAAVVHRAGLCRETGTHSQTSPCGNAHHRRRLGPFHSSHRNGIHAHWCYIKKEEKWSSITVSIHFSG